MIELDTQKTLTKADLADLISNEIGLNKREAKEFIEEFFEELCKALIRGEDVKITGFGNFEVRSKGARPGRNPRTGEPVEIAPRRVVTFHSGTTMKGLVEDAPQ